MRCPTKTKRNGVYGSGLAEQDWVALKNAIWPFIHAKNPGLVEVPTVPDHLMDHPVIQAIRKFRETGDNVHLDAAGTLLIPCSEPFGWYVPLTK
jgi:hypothetical protein